MTSAKTRKPRKRRAYSGSVRYPRLRDLIDLVRQMQANAGGISLADIQSRFSVSRRTAERMRDAACDTFPEVEEYTLDDGTKRWRLKDRVLVPSAGLEADDLAALQTIGKLLERGSAAHLAPSLARAAEALRAGMRWSDLLRAEPDIEALTEAEGIASRPGPREKIEPQVLAALRSAIKSANVVKLTHWTAEGKQPSRGHEVEPLGILYSVGRVFLVGRSRHHAEIHLFRLSRILEVDVTEKAFVPPRGFSIADFARQSFGVFRERPSDIALRFAPKVRRDAMSFLFHPTQVVEPQGDGSVIVRFKAGGLRELCWFLFTWGARVKIEKPAKLCALYRQLLAEAARAAKP